MKKLLLIFTSILLIICSPISKICFAANNENPAMLNDPPALQNIIARLMIKDIQKAVDNYYLEYLFNSPQIEVYEHKSSTKVLDIGYDSNNNLYLITIEVHPYIGAHNTIGHDRITFEISGSANVKVREFKHIKSFELVPWLKDELKKPFPADTY